MSKKMSVEESTAYVRKIADDEVRRIRADIFVAESRLKLMREALRQAEANRKKVYAHEWTIREAKP